jgi:PHP family Zn ribbon phosphoesterase
VTSLIFKKADLHIHTPESDCYGDISVTPEQIVDTSLSVGLEVIAITDHNTFRAIESIRGVAERKGLFVFPGVELSTKSGHFIALFETGTPLNILEDFLDYLPVDRESWGDGTAKLRIETEEVLEKIARQGGLAIAAHIERWPSGFLESGESRRVKMKIHASRYLSALEITIPQNRVLWNNGEVRDYPKKHACIQGSDAHNLDEIGRRPVYIKMDSVSLEALKSAFNDYEERIAFPEEYNAGERK